MTLADALVPEEADGARDRAWARLETEMRARPTAPIRRRSRLFSPRALRASAVGGMAVVAAAVGINLLPASPSSPLDPGRLLDQAAAAVMPPASQIFHSVMVVREFGTEDGRPVASHTTYEVWHLSGVAERGIHTAADGTVLSDTVDSAKELRAHHADGVANDTDPGLLSGMKEQADTGQATLTIAGSATIDGHETTKLVAIPRRVFRGTINGHKVTIISEVRKAVLYIDKRTSMPVRLEQYYAPNFPGTEGVRMTKTHDIQDYTLLERLPDTLANRKLLRPTHHSR
jgi:hypothetical protein